VTGCGGSRCWSSRRSVALKAALESNPDRDRDDPLQHVIEQLIEGGQLDLVSMRERTGGARGRARVVRRSSPGAFGRRRRARRCRWPPSCRRCIDWQTRSFGRSSELRQLEDFVGVIEATSLRSRVRRIARGTVALVAERTPLFIHGPGGIGKSTLVAQFVLSHLAASGDQRLPFAYLDLERAALDPARPLTLLLEMQTQLIVQFPESSRAAARHERSRCGRRSLAMTRRNPTRT